MLRRPNLISKQATAIAVVVLSLAAALVPAGVAQAQVGLYTVSGDITGPNGDPLEGAEVSLIADNASDEKRTTTTDGDGAYSFSNVEEGSYDVTARHACCSPAFEHVDVGGTTLEHTVDLQLEQQDEPRGNETVVLRGTVVDRASGDAVPNASISIENWFDPDGQTSEPESDDPQAHEEKARMIAREGEHQRFHLRSGADGTYAVELNPGQVHLQVEREGYDDTRAWFHIEADKELEIPMRASDDEVVTITGVVRSTDGEPLTDAWVSVSRDHRTYCDGDVCYAEASSGREVSEGDDRDQRDDVTFHFDRAASPYDSTHTDEDGRYTLRTVEGPIRLSANARDHLSAERSLEVTAGERKQIDLELTPIPPDSVRVHGTVTDAGTGEPIPFARVQLENPKWGHWNSTWADEDGTYELYTKPGYTIVTARADQYVHRPCEEPEPAARSASSDGNASASSAMVPPERRCEPDEREHVYYSRSMTFVGEAGGAQSFDPALQRAPEATATFEGWVVNASSEEGIADARISFHNEATNEWGRASTDGDGSYTIDVRPGYYTVRAYADGFYEAVRNVEIAEGQTQRLVLEMTPGQSRHGGCCIAYAEPVGYDEATAREDSASASAGGDGGGSAADTQESRADRGPEEGQLVFEGSAGSLGPYPGPSAAHLDQDGDGDETEQPVPSAGLLAVLAFVGLGALTLKIWDRRR